ncbi:MAG: hypothetical protein U0787_16540 [Polyangia bacterium]
MSAKDASAFASRKVLVLSVSDDGRQLDGLRAEIQDSSFGTGGYAVDDALLPTCQACLRRDPGCLRELAKKWEAERGVGADFQTAALRAVGRSVDL